MLSQVADGVWVATEPVRIAGTRLTTTMTVLRGPDDALLLHSPVPLTAERRAAIEALGSVAHLYAPNTYHHLFIGEWSAAYPAARVHAPAALAKKRPDLRIDRAHDVDREPGFGGWIEEVRIEGFRLDESALVYAPARTLVVADLVHNIGRPPGAWTRLYTGAMGFYDRVALSRALRWLAFSDRAAARRSVDAILAREPDVLVVGHGAPITEGAAAALAAACAWLPG